MKKIKVFEAFAGYGGCSWAMKKANIPYEVIGFSEIDKYAIAVYKYHFPEVKNYGNATGINPNDLPDFDLLTAGFPCQAFSIAGKRQGLEDCRGTLFYEIARIVSVKRPELLLLENVKGLLSHDKGRTFGLILSTFSDLGYICEWQILNSKDFGVPHDRERTFIVGHFGKKCTKTIFPIKRKTRGTLICTHEKLREDGLSQQGDRMYSIKGVSSGRKALAELENSKPKLILLDIILPDIDGYEICRTIREDMRFDDVTIYYITAKS